MWDEQQRARFQALRQREDEGALTEPERGELAALIQELEEAEAAYLRPATERLEAECRRIQAQNAALRKRAARREKLVRRLREVLAKVEQ